MIEGLYTNPRGDFKSADDIKREAYIKDLYQPPIIGRNTPEKQDFVYWSDRLQDRQKEYRKTEEISSVAEVEFFDDTLVSLQADLHIGGVYTDYKRIEDEARAIVENPNPNTGVFLLGDLIDAFFFNSAQFDALEQTPEQIEYARALVRYYYDNGKLLGIWLGNHDLWVKKSGFNPYKYILQDIDTNYFHGIGYVTAKLGDKKINIAGNHMFKGSSMYSPTHPQRRAINEGARGADIVVSGHWHDKGITQLPIKEFGGDSRVTTLIALGTYKSSDDYVRTYGFTNRDPKSMYGASVLLKKDGSVVASYDILKANGEHAKR